MQVLVTRNDQIIKFMCDENDFGRLLTLPTKLVKILRDTKEGLNLMLD